MWNSKHFTRIKWPVSFLIAVTKRLAETLLLVLEVSLCPSRISMVEVRSSHQRRQQKERQKERQDERDAAEARV